jgi:tRNA(fMet)-specific endonuclease VapC
MMEPRTLLDTDILSLLLRQDPVVLSRSERYLSQHGELTISAVTRYEIMRGLKVKRATSQLAAFDFFCRRNCVLPLADVIFDRATDIYADLHSRGQLILDADIFIAATALEHGFALATRNASHFERIPGLVVENW